MGYALRVCKERCNQEGLEHLNILYKIVFPMMNAPDPSCRCIRNDLGLHVLSQIELERLIIILHETFKEFGLNVKPYFHSLTVRGHTQIDFGMLDVMVTLGGG